jgi:hypothetical protein
MPSQAVSERLCTEIGEWLADGLVTPQTAGRLRQRYQATRFDWAHLVRLCGIAGGMLALFGLLGFIAAMSDSPAVGGVLAAGVGGALLAAGLRLGRHESGRYAYSAKALLVLAVLGVAGGILLLLTSAGVEEKSLVPLTGLIVIPAVGWLAYRQVAPFLLVLDLVAAFHWVGSFTKMLGRSTYEVAVQDERLMATVALGALLVGLWHERFAERLPRFATAYQALGLTYFNLCLLILSFGWDGPQLFYVLLLTFAALAQVVAGARLHNALLVGFGVTMLFVDGFTRFHEYAWNRLSLGAFFLVGGGLLFAAGVGCELALRRLRGAA